MQPHPQPGAPAAAPPAQPPALAPGSILRDRYLIQGYINGGGFGHIYKALDNALGYRRAIKEAFYQDPQTRQQFYLEAEFLINVRHPNLVAGYAVFEQDGRLYLVMEYVDGHTLEEIAIEHIRRTAQPLREARILDWVLPICGALHALHSSPRPVIHRDVKPANVKVNRKGVPVLIDLGLAKLFAQGTTTIGAALAFTPGYAPPEQYRATGATDARTDVYGMGATLFYLLTGYQPTEAPARLGSLAVPPLCQLNPAISPLTEAAVLRAMELLPESRQQSALELERDLRAARAALPSVTRTAPWSLSLQPDVRCSSCGADSPAAARHCIHCGVPLARQDGAPANGVHGTHGADMEWLLATQAASPAPATPQLGRPTRPIEREPRRDAEAANGSMDPTPDDGAAHATGDAASLISAETWQPVAPAAAVELPSAPLADTHSALVPGPDSLPDQPAIAMPPLRRGPAPTAKPLTPSVPQQDLDVSGESPPAGPQRQPLGSRHAAEGQVPPPLAGRPRAAAGGIAVPAALWSFAVPSLRRWHVETLSAAAPLDDAEVRLVLAGIMSLIFAVGTLLSIRNPLALVLALPALALGHWCQRAAGERALHEARWLAMLGLAISYAWLGLYVVAWLVVAVHTWL